MCDHDWLPALFEFDWNRYIECVEQAYLIFNRDFASGRPNFLGKKMGLMKYPIEDGKPRTFWHFITEGKIEADRTPVRERIERIEWPMAMIRESLMAPSRVLKWKQDNRSRWIVSLTDFSYVVVIDERKKYVLTLTAYPVEHPHRRDKLRREYLKCSADA